MEVGRRFVRVLRAERHNREGIPPLSLLDLDGYAAWRSHFHEILRPEPVGDDSPSLERGDTHTGNKSRLFAKVL